MQLLKNTGFEEGIPDHPKYWGKYNTGTTQIYIYPEQGRNVGSSAAIEYQTRETGKVAAWVQSFQIDHTKRYKFSGWLKAANIVGGGANMKIDWKNAAGGYLSTSNIMTSKIGTIPWTYFEGDNIVPNPNAAIATVVLELHDCSGKVWFDDLSYSDMPILTTINISISESIHVGDTKELEPICKDQDNNIITCPTLNWSSNNIPVATVENTGVNNTGLVTGISAGAADITAKYGSPQDIYSNIATVTVTALHPNLFLNSSEINIIKSRITTEPWLSAYNKLMNTYVPEAITVANNPPTIVNNGPTPPTGDQHDYYTTFDHLQRQDYTVARNITKSIRHLALAYVLTGNNTYADKVIKLIYHWCADPNKRMNNRLFYAGQQYSAIETEGVVTFPGMFYGADLIWNYNGGNWSYNSVNVKAAFITWVQGIINDAKRITRWGCGGTPFHCQNLEYGRLSLIASGSVITGDSAGLSYVYDRWKKLITGFTDINNVVIAPIMQLDGRLPYEMSRTTPITYTTFCLNHMTQIAEISRHQGGPDLYHYKVNPSSGDNRGLELAFDYISPYVINPASLGGKKANCADNVCTPVNTGGTYINTSVCQTQCLHSDLGSPMYELAYTYIGNKTSYKNCINTYKRPMYDDKNMGPVTLTHGSKFV